ncbi:MAG: amidohydrolase family protein [Rhodospirillales bacterium]|jgi:hypothetical protein|nr:amidohydrolase family protein [Rhodospirillales bacterium]
MAYSYDIVLKNGCVVDPVNGRNGRYDVAVAGGRIAAVAPDLDPSQAPQSFDLSGRHVFPGIIDTHVHVSPWIGGRFGHKMLAAAGVTTALDVAGPIEGVLDIARDYGVGLNLACIHYVRPGHTVEGEDPGDAELDRLLDSCMKSGALGVKILGGHYPLTPEATARTIRLANRRGAYVAFHAGTLASGSNLTGLLEAVDLIGGNHAHLAHINSYCRGQVEPAVEEGEKALAALQEAPTIYSEAYLATINGTSAKCSDGVPESLGTRTCLKLGGFAPTEKGMEEAILAGWALINLEEGGAVVLASGPTAAEYWKRNGTDASVSFKVNPPEPRLRLATAKRRDGEFVVDSISTDGGGIPRNLIIAMGLPLVRLEALTLEEFVVKTSRNPARALGLADKGHLSEGADADITVADLETSSPYMSLSNGQVIMFRGHVCGKGTRMITTPAGEAHVREKGLDVLTVDPAKTPFLRMR